MDRGLNQILFNFTPGSLYDNVDVGYTCKVIRINDDLIVESIDAELILDRLESVLDRHYVNNNNRQFLNFDKEKFIVLEPISIESEIDPLSFECNTCGNFSKYNNLDDYEKKWKRSKNNCLNKNCNGKMVQFNFIMYHNCGYLNGIYKLNINDCNHDKNYFFINKNSSDQPRFWQWQCRLCNKKREFYYPCGEADCKAIRQNSNIAPFRKSDVYLPQIIKAVGVDRDYRRTENIKLIIGQMLGYIEKNELKNYFENSENSKIKMIEEMRGNLKNSGVSDSEIENILRMGFEGYEKITAERDKINEVIEKIEKFDLNLITNKNMAEISYMLNSDRYEEKAFENDDENINSLGIKEMGYLDDLSIIMANYGYTRQFNDNNINDIAEEHQQLREKRKRTALIGYSYQQSKTSERENKFPIFAGKYNTEGIIIKFDKAKLMKYTNKKMSRNVYDLKDIDNYNEQFLLNNSMEINQFGDVIKNEGDVGKNEIILNILHSISHFLMKSAGIFSGLDVSSLGELIYPEVGAIVIFDNQTQDDRIGALKTLIETRLEDWIDKAIVFSKNCINDTMCLDRAEDDYSIGNKVGACFACLYISEVNCVFFNKHLDRRMLIGSNDIPSYYDLM